MKVAIEVGMVGSMWEFKAMVVERKGDENEYTPVCQWMSTSRQNAVEKGLKSLKKLLKDPYYD